MCVPVFDTLRVMGCRMLRGKSPFRPDKTHLHHLFIDLGFSHIGTTAAVLTINLIVVALWWVSYVIDASIEVQLYVVLASGALLIFGFYRFMRLQMKGNTCIYRFMCRIGRKTHIENCAIVLHVQNWLDSIVTRGESVSSDVDET